MRKESQRALILAAALLTLVGCSARPAAQGGRPGSLEPELEGAPAALTSAAPGCEASALGVLKDEGFVPVSGRFGNPPELPLLTGRVQLATADGVAIDGSVPLLPDHGASGLAAPSMLWVDSVDSLTLIYSANALVADETYSSLMAKSGVLVEQAPFEGRDADLVLQAVTSNRWRVQLQKYPAALVWGDPISEGVRPFGLYWADEHREWIAKGAVDADLLVDLARSIYC